MPDSSLPDEPDDGGGGRHREPPASAPDSNAGSPEPLLPVPGSNVPPGLGFVERCTKRATENWQAVLRHLVFFGGVLIFLICLLVATAIAVKVAGVTIAISGGTAAAVGAAGAAGLVARSYLKHRK